MTIKQVLFNVEVDQTDHTMRVLYDSYSFDALAIVLIESLKAFKQMNHRDAVNLYSDSWKRSEPDSYGIKDVIKITDCDQSITEYDHTVDDTKLVDIDEYWTGDEYDLAVTA